MGLHETLTQATAQVGSGRGCCSAGRAALFRAVLSHWKKPSLRDCNSVLPAPNWPAPLSAAAAHPPALCGDCPLLRQVRLVANQHDYKVVAVVLPHQLRMEEGAGGEAMEARTQWAPCHASDQLLLKRQLQACCAAVSSSCTAWRAGARHRAVSVACTLEMNPWHSAGCTATLASVLPAAQRSAACCPVTHVEPAFDACKGGGEGDVVHHQRPLGPPVKGPHQGMVSLLPCIGAKQHGKGGAALVPSNTGSEELD